MPKNVKLFTSELAPFEIKQSQPSHSPHLLKVKGLTFFDILRRREIYISEEILMEIYRSFKVILTLLLSLNI